MANANQDKIAALIAARSASIAAGISPEAFDKLMEAEVAPLRASANETLTKAIQTVLGKMDMKKTVGNNGSFYGSAKFAAVLTFNEDGTESTWTVERIDGKKKAKSTKNGGTRAESVTKGKVLLIDEMGFHSYAAATAFYEITSAGANQRPVYEDAHKANPTKFPATQLVDRTEFYANHATLAPKGFYKNKNGAAVKTEVVR